jgi:hypothetical protein
MPRLQSCLALTRLAVLPLAAFLTSVGTAAGLDLLVSPGALAQTKPTPSITGVANTGATQPATPTLSVDEARAAAERILKAVQSGNAELRYSQFSDELKAVSSPAMVAATMRQQGKLLSWTLLSVRSGLRTTTVEVSARTSEGMRDLFLVLNTKGQLAGYHLDLTDEKPSIVAGDFVKALSTGQFITARSFLSLPMQSELSARALQAKWMDLQRYTGNFVGVRRVVEAENSAEGRLVLVYTDFNRLSDNLYVILNTNNEIIGVDFPQDPKLSR